MPFWSGLGVRYLLNRSGAVLQDLEAETASDVKDIGLDDMVDTDPATGKPVLRKAVDIDVRKRTERSWVR